jgi:hypothetical protein
LNTLSELADAFGNDADFAATVTSLLAAKAPLASPAFTGTPTAPTPSAGDNSTKIATTAYADGGMADHLSADDPHGVKAELLASAAFTASPTAPTPSAGDNSTKLATTAYADGAVADHVAASDPHGDRAYFAADPIGGTMQTPADGTYTLVLKAKYAFTINALDAILESGTITMAVKINGTAVTGISGLAVTSTIGTATATAANAVVVGDKVEFTLSSNASGSMLDFILDCTR